MTSDWTYAKWVEVDATYWRFMFGTSAVGMASQADDGTFEWFCETSDHWQGGAATVEQAKTDCEEMFWKDAWDVVGTSRPPALAHAA